MRRAATTALALLLPAAPCAGEERYGTFYLYGYVNHFEPTPRTNQGNMRYFGLSRELRRDKWRFDTGFATYVDSYRVRSYSVFSDISHDDYALRYLRPMLSLQCQSKGHTYSSEERQFLCFPLPKLRIGGDAGPLVNISGTPKVGKLTNGFAVAEFGIRW
jgi:hypothetical protein